MQLAGCGLGWAFHLPPQVIIIHGKLGNVFEGDGTEQQGHDQHGGRNLDEIAKGFDHRVLSFLLWVSSVVVIMTCITVVLLSKLTLDADVFYE
jgi:hypothetical protein